MLEWHQIYTTLEAALPILDSCEMFIGQSFRCFLWCILFELLSRDSGDKNYINQLLKTCNIQIMRNLFHILSVSLDFDQSRLEGVLTIRNGYDHDLDQLRYLPLFICFPNSDMSMIILKIHWSPLRKE